jgi:hypothetical protein
MSDAQTPIPRGGAGPAPGKRKSAAAVPIIIIGIVLLLPGLCSLYFVTSFAITEPHNLFKFSDPGVPRAIWILWGICFLVAIGGTLLLRLGWRR